MSKQTGLILFSLLFIPYLLISQATTSIFMPKEIKKAYAKGTRDREGFPGADYWQNTVSYKIKAELFPKERKISGSETIVYTNNSPDTLDRLYFNIIQDLYKKGSSRDWDLGPDDITSGINIKSVKINGITIDLNGNSVNRNSTLLMIYLKEKLMPYMVLNITIRWDCILPAKRTVRMGTYGGTNFMAAYWYPSVAVYDDINGWDNIPHTGNCEFYNEFSNYDVQITAPADYVLLSTGLLQNENEIFTDEILQRMKKAYTTDEVVHIITKEDRQKKNYLKSGAHNWHFKINRVTDFAFAASNKYLWDATSVQSGPRRVRVNSFYKESSPDFPKVADVARKVIAFFTNEAPKINFPFPQMTIFNGHGGMEFPGMVNQGDSKTYTETLFVTSHEIGHSYFPFATGLNEELYAWMDEGLITFFPKLFVAKYTDDKNYVPFAKIVSSYNYYAGSFMDMPLIIPSSNTGRAYRYQAYTHGATAIYMLYEYLGADNFFYDLRLFAKRWKGKHPTPYDFFFTFNQGAHQDLGWFWKPWFMDLRYADLAVQSAGDNAFKIINKGGVPVPVHLKITYKDGTYQDYDKPASIWKGSRNVLTIKFNIKLVKEITLDTKLTPDAFPENNTLTVE